jgi:hypothetical protein
MGIAQENETTEVYDAVVSCIGNYFEPNLPDVDGIAACPLEQMHSHNYRSSQPFQDKIVLVVGAAFSGVATTSGQSADVLRDTSRVGDVWGIVFLLGRRQCQYVGGGEEGQERCGV